MCSSDLDGVQSVLFRSVNIDGKIISTSFYSPEILGINDEVTAEELKKLKISQVEKNKEILSTTK